MLDFESLNKALKEKKCDQVISIGNDYQRAVAVRCLDKLNKIENLLFASQESYDYEIQDTLKTAIIDTYDFAVRENFLDGEKRYLSDKFSDIVRMCNSFPAIA